MKTYKISNSEVSADEIRRLIRENPELAKGEESWSRFFRPNEDQEFWVLTKTEVESDTYDPRSADSKRVARGAYRTREEAELADQKRMAIVRLWNWADENAHFRPDWKDGSQVKYYAAFSHFHLGKITEEYCTYGNQYQFTLPYFKANDDCRRFIDENKVDLELLFLR